MTATLRERNPRIGRKSDPQAKLEHGDCSSSASSRGAVLLTAGGPPFRSRSAEYALILLGWSAHIEKGGRLTLDEFMEARER